MERKFLEDLGLEAEVIEKILAESDRGLSNTQTVSDAELKAEKKRSENLNAELEKANATLARLQTANQDNDKMQREIESYKKQIDEIRAKADADRVDWTIDLALERAGAINPATVRPLLNMDAIMIGKDGQVAGVDEQIQAILGDERNGFLFRSSEPANEPEPQPEPVQVVRGGYEPLAADAAVPEKKQSGPSLGAQAAEYVTNRKQSIEDAVSSFWSGGKN